MYTGTFLGRDVLRLVLAAPLLDEVVHGGQLFLNLIGIGIGLVYFVDGKDDGHTGSHGMIDGLFGLRHDIVIGCHDNDDHVRHLGTTGTHGGKRLMTRCVEERDTASVLQLHIVGTDVLRDTSRLTGNHIGLADIVEQRCLSMVDVTHHGHNRGTRHQVFFGIHLLYDGLRHLGTDVFGLIAEFLGHQVDGLGIQTLVDGDHDADTHTRGDDLRHRDVHHVGQFVGGHKLRQLQYLAFFLFQFLLFQLAVLDILTFLLAVLGGLVLALVGEAGQRFLHLLGHIFIAHFLLHHRFLETVFGMLATALCDNGSGLLAAFLLTGRTRHGLRSVAHVDALLADAVAFFLLGRIIGHGRLVFGLTDFLDDGILHLLALFLALLVFFLALLALLFFRLFLRTGRLIQGRQVYLSYHVDCRLEFGRTYLEHFLPFLLLVLCCW